MLKYKLNYWVCILLIFVLMNTQWISVSANEDINEDIISENEYAALQSHGVYTVGFSTTHYPFTYINSKDEAAGIAIDLMDEIAEKANIEVSYVAIDASNQEGIDINLSLFYEDQLSYHDFTSDIYVSFPLIGVGIIGVDSNYEDITVGRLDYYSLTNEDVSDVLEGAQSKVYYNYSDMQNALNANEIDYLVASSLVATDVLDLSNDDSYEIFAFDYRLEIPFTLSENISLEIKEAFNSVIQSLDEEVVYTIVVNAILLSDKKLTTIELLYEYKAVIITCISLLLGIIVSIALYYYYHNRKILLEMINKDSLTGLMSERKFVLEVNKALKRKKKYKIISIDIDNFKYINEVYGYETGTMVLVAIANYLKNAMRDSIAIARVYSDNFLVLREYDKTNDENNMILDYETYIKGIVGNVLNKSFDLTTSTGVYLIDDTSLSVSYMIDCANLARRTGKSKYGHSYIIFDDYLKNEMKRKNEIVSSMVNAIEKHEFFVMYQPKIDFITGEIHGAEALVRWKKKNGSYIFPDEFIPLFEENGFIKILDLYVLNEVCEFISRNHIKIPIAINLSGISFLDENLVSEIKAIIQSHNISTSLIEIEITESAMVYNFDIILNKINELRTLGFVIAMDDFGTGVSSLHRLKDLAIDVLKIDKHFLGDSLDYKKGIFIIENIINMAKQLSLLVVAEGVETIEQVQLLKSLQCDLAQGYYFKKPLLEHEFIDLLESEELPWKF